MIGVDQPAVRGITGRTGVFLHGLPVDHGFFLIHGGQCGINLSVAVLIDIAAAVVPRYDASRVGAIVEVEQFGRISGSESIHDCFLVDIRKNRVPGHFFQLYVEAKLFSDIDEFQPQFLTVDAVSIEQFKCSFHPVFIDGSISIGIGPACLFQQSLRAFHIRRLVVIKNRFFIQPGHLLKTRCRHGPVSVQDTINHLLTVDCHVKCFAHCDVTGDGIADLCTIFCKFPLCGLHRECHSIAFDGCNILKVCAFHRHVCQQTIDLRNIHIAAVHCSIGSVGIEEDQREPLN